MTLQFNLIGSYSKMEQLSGFKPKNDVLFEQYEDHLVLTHDIPRKVARNLI